MKTLSLILMMAICHISFGQDYHSEFLKLCQSSKKDTLKQLTLLTEWEKASPEDPELFTSYFNYYFSKSKRFGLTLTQSPPEGEVLTIYDSTDQAQGFLVDDLFFEEAEFQKGIDKLNQGIKLYPNRLDMRFGKAYALGKKKDWAAFTETIKETIIYSSTNNQRWQWTLNDSLPDAEEVFFTSLHDYQLQLYNTGNKDLLVNMREIALEILTYYPDHVVSLSNVAITYLLAEQPDKAL
ncbi:MAG: tetratricopeptide repeat protein, partial [Bacteroidota bacterium]